MKSKETQLAYLQRRVAALTKMVQQRDMMIDTLVRDIDLTESVGCAFAFDLAGWLGEYEVGCVLKKWDEAMAGEK